MEFDSRNTDNSGRLRLIDVRLKTGDASMHFGGGLAGVYTTTSERSRAAHQIVATVMGPRPADASGSVDINGRIVSVHSLPLVPLPASAPAVLDRDDLNAHWQALCARRRGELAATHASRRLERHRIAAALDRARAREAGRADPNAFPAAVSAYPSQAVSSNGVTAELRAQVRELMQTIDSLASVPSPEALALADAWDAHTAFLRARALEPAIDIEAAEERVKRARMAVAMSTAAITDQARDEIDRRHRDVVEAEARLFEARRKARGGAVARYEAAVAAEKVALSDAGVDSYASFLVALTGGGSPAEDRHAAQQELISASTALDAARRAVGPSEVEDVHQRGVELRAHAERLLGRPVVGGDPPAELRAIRLEAPDRSARIRELIGVLEAAGVTRGDALKSARELLSTEPPERPVASTLVDSLEEEQARHEHSLAVLEAEIARLDQIYDADIEAVAADDLGQVVESVLTSYRAGNLLGGRLPVVLDGALDRLTPEARDAAVTVLAGAVDVQSIVVTDDLEVMKSLTRAGGTIVLWPEADVSPLPGRELQITPHPGA
jgi:hypothetical protein